MADPIVSGVRKAMWIWKGASGLSKDRYVNNFYFHPSPSPDPNSDTDNIFTALTEFWNGAAANGQRLSNYMNGPGISGAELRVYDIGLPPPREPQIRQAAFTLPASGTPLPGETAFVLSFRSAQSGPRGRGRIYIGPLLSSAATTTGGKSVPAQVFMDTVIDRATHLMNIALSIDWVQVSRMDGAQRNVTGGWVDDSWDTQRSRGIQPTARKVFGDAYVLAA